MYLEMLYAGMRVRFGFGSWEHLEIRFGAHPARIVWLVKYTS